MFKRTRNGTQITLHNDDCITVMKELEDRSVDLIIADPPYKLEMPNKTGVDGLLKGKRIKLVNEDWDKFTLDSYIAFTENWLREAFRVVKPTGSVFIFGSYHNIGLVNFVLQKNNWMIINDIAWYKRNAVPNLACRRLTASYESILWSASSKKYTFNYDDMKNGTFSEDKLKAPGKQMRNVWDIPTNGSENVGHPTQKPVKLYERIIQMACSKEANAVVLDPFGGSGTLAVAASNLGIDSMLIEMNSTYTDIILKRIADAPSLDWLQVGEQDEPTLPGGGSPTPSERP
jgi:DNA modification methylase